MTEIMCRQCGHTWNPDLVRAQTKYHGKCPRCGSRLREPDYEETGYPEASGTSTFSGDGMTVAFVIPHGLDSAPTWVSLEAKSSGAIGDKYWSADATNITVTFITAPPTGVNNVIIAWKGEVW